MRQKKETQKIKRVESGLYEEKLLNSEGNTADAEEQQSEKRCSCGPDFKLSLFKNPRFVLYWVAFMICTAGYGNNLILIPAQIRALGYDKRSVSTAVAITGGSEIVARISAGWLADKKWIRPKWIFTISYFVSAVLTFLTPHIHNLDYMYVYAATVGLFPASFWSLISVMIIDVVGMDEFPAAYGLVLPGFAVGLCVNQFAIGEWPIF